MKRICVYCGSKVGVDAEYQKVATRFGDLLAELKIGLVYGGAKVGLMGAVADAVLNNGGEVIGVIPRYLRNKEVAHTELTELRLVNSMHERKALMEELSDAFVALPGGLGTFEEFFEILTWAQLGLHHKPVGLLNVRNYYDALLDLVERGIEQGFIPPEHRKLLMVASEPETLLEAFKNYQPLNIQKWITRTSET